MDAESAADSRGANRGIPSSDSEPRQQRSAPREVIDDDPAAAAEEQHEEAPTGRLGEILGMMGQEIPEELRESLRTEKEGKAGAGDKPAAGDEEEEQETKEEEVEAVAGAEEELTSEQQKQWPTEALDRIHKLTAQRKDVREELEGERQLREAAEAERDQLREQNGRAPALPATADNPLAGVQDFKDLEKAEADLEDIKAWAELHREEGGDYEIGKDKDGNPIVQTFDAEQTAKILINSDRVLRKQVPERKEFLKVRQHTDAIAREEYPAIFDPKSEDGKLAQKVLQLVPELMRFSDGRLQLGAYLEGLKILQAKLAARAKGAKPNGNGSAAVKPFQKPAVKRAPHLPSVEHSRSTVPEKPAIKAAEEKARETGGDERSIQDLVSSLRADQGGQNRATRRAA